MGALAPALQLPLGAWGVAVFLVLQGDQDMKSPAHASLAAIVGQTQQALAALRAEADKTAAENAQLRAVIDDLNGKLSAMGADYSEEQEGQAALAEQLKSAAESAGIALDAPTA